MQKVYVEVVFADNFVVNFLIVLLAHRLTNTHIRWGRSACAAAVGGIYASVAFGGDGMITSFFIKIAVSLFMCFIAFWSRGEKKLLKNLCAFYISAFVIAGAIYACMQGVTQAGGAIAITPVVRAILFGLASGATLIGGISRTRRRMLQNEAHTALLTLNYGGKKTQVKTFIDTGNLLTEPLSGLDVIFLSRAASEALLDDPAMRLLQGKEAGATDRLRFIPCATAAGQTVLYGVEIDNVCLQGGTESVRAVACMAKNAPAGGCGAIAGSILMDKLMKGAIYDQVADTKDSGLAAAEAAAHGKRGLYQWKRGASAAAVGRRGGGAAGSAGQGRQVGEARADRA